MSYENLAYSYKITYFKGKQIFEVLVNGEPFGVTFPWDEHFRFGETKARLIVMCMPYIKKFALNPSSLQKTIRSNNCIIEPHDFFERNGQIIDKPYLKLTDTFTWVSIGLGQEKAKAVIALKKDIERFASLKSPIIHSQPTVQIGSTVRILLDNQEETFTIVHPTESNPTKGLISFESPIGKALLERQENETFTALTPSGKITITILKILRH
ncbi:MAG: GreA/GreB family elongation factor [Ardenticatenia bacterium]|nr:MAG: GreA/GreB family elongation factor [Ardenticatenia bacterium]